MNNDIKLCQKEELCFCRAGSSFGSLTQTRKQVPLGEELKILAEQTPHILEKHYLEYTLADLF